VKSVAAYENVGISLSDALSALQNQKVRIFANGTVETVIIISADQNYVRAVNVRGDNTGGVKIYNTLNIDYVEAL
jgi:hypothetical protein